MLVCSLPFSVYKRLPSISTSRVVYTILSLIAVSLDIMYYTSNHPQISILNSTLFPSKSIFQTPSPNLQTHHLTRTYSRTYSTTYPTAHTMKNPTTQAYSKLNLNRKSQFQMEIDITLTPSLKDM